MSHINDLIDETLEKELFTGSLDDKISAWLESAGATGDHLNDLWESYFDLQIIPAGQFDDRMVAWYKANSATGEAQNDLAKSYWAARLLL